MLKKIIPALLAAFTLCLTGCSNKTCYYCGEKAIWKAQETFLGEPMGDPVYVCGDCKRAGKGPHASLEGNTIKWTHL